MKNEILKILYSIPNKEIEELYTYMFGEYTCDNNCKVCNKCVYRDHIFRYFRTYVYMRHYTTDNKLKENLNIKSYILYSWFSYMNEKYKIEGGK